MDSRHTSGDKQRFTDAGEQAARVIGEFMSMANEFSKKFDQSFDSGTTDTNSARTDKKESLHTKYSEACNDRNNKNDHFDENWQKGGEYLRELREAAGYTIDGFAKAMNRHDAVRTVEAAEAGREVFPQDWFDQAIEVLQHSDPREFFDKLRSCYEPLATNHHSASESSSVEQNDLCTLRRQKLNAIFSDDEALQNLTDSQFEELAGFMRSNYQAALQLVANKPKS